MFEDSGNKIKCLAVVVFWVLVAAGVISALGLIINGFALIDGYGVDEGGGMVFCGILLIPLSILSAYISELVLYGFGEIVQNCMEIKTLVQSTYDITYESYSMNYDDREAAKRKVAVSNLERAAQTMNKTGASSWRCPSCDMNNDGDDKFCRKCGKAR